MLSYFNYYYIFFSKQLSTNCAFVNNTVNSARFCSHPLEGVSHQSGTSPSAGRRLSRNNRKYRKKKKRVYPLTPGAIDYPRQDHKKYE